MPDEAPQPGWAQVEPAGGALWISLARIDDSQEKLLALIDLDLGLLEAYVDSESYFHVRARTDATSRLRAGERRASIRHFLEAGFLPRVSPWGGSNPSDEASGTVAA